MAEFFIQDFPTNWFIFILLGILLTIVLTYLSKDRKDILKFGFVGLVSGLVIEVVGVGLGLWTYTGGNWPWTLWVSYFVLGIAWFQLAKVLEKYKFF